MSTISRPPKAGGTNQYVTEVAAGHEDIIDSEVDNDLNTIYNDYNGNITTANIAVGAGITHDKLNLAGSIVNADIAPNSLVGFNVLYPGSVHGGQIGGNEINRGHITPGNAVWDYATLFINGFTGLVGENVVGEITWGSRGQVAHMSGKLSGGYNSGPGLSTVTMRLRLGGTPGVADGTVVDFVQVQAQLAGTFPLNLTADALYVPPSATVWRLKLTLACEYTGQAVPLGGRLSVIEWP